MANLKSSKKDIRRIKRRTALNQTLKKRVKRNEKDILKRIASGEEKIIDVKSMQKALDKAVKKGYMKKNTANRKKSRLMKKLSAKTEKK